MLRCELICCSRSMATSGVPGRTDAVDFDRSKAVGDIDVGGVDVVCGPNIGSEEGPECGGRFEENGR